MILSCEELESENARLQQKLADLEKEWGEKFGKEKADFLKFKAAYEAEHAKVQKLILENEGLKSSEFTKWFIMGALVLLCGLLLGTMIGRQQRKSRSSYL